MIIRSNLRAKKVVGFFLIVLVSMQSAWAIECAKNQEELRQTRRLYKIVEDLGGFSRLEGSWYFPGIFGIGKTTIEFQSFGERFEAKLIDSKNNSNFVAINFCESDNQDSFVEVKVYTLPESTMVHIKNGSGNKIQLAAEKSNWRYYDFAKISSSVDIILAEK